MLVTKYYEGYAAYSAAKAGLEVMMKTLAVEEEGHGLQVYLFEPGNVRSEQNPLGEVDPSAVAEKMFELTVKTDSMNLLKEIKGN